MAYRPVLLYESGCVLYSLLERCLKGGQVLKRNLNIQCAQSRVLLKDSNDNFLLEHTVSFPPKLV